MGISRSPRLLPAETVEDLSMDQLLVVLIIALVTGAFSFTGIWIGARLTRGNEDRKWRRDHILEAYSELIHAVEVVISEAGLAYGEACGTESHTKRREVVLESCRDASHEHSRNSAST